MKKYYVGIDSGSTLCKAVLFDKESNALLEMQSVKTGWNPKLSANDCIKLLLKKNSLTRENVCISTTGYGREAIDFADCTFTEITCHGLGGIFLHPDIGGVIDIGGQDSKVIQLGGSSVVDFLMNDKCAAGTGRFLSMACDTLGISLEEIDLFAHPCMEEAITINSMCTVFAESEIIGSLAMQKDRAKILTGVLRSIAQKTSQMTGKFAFNKTDLLFVTGGLSRSDVLVSIIAKTIGIKVITHKYATFAGAIGACVCAIKTEKNRSL